MFSPSKTKFIPLVLSFLLLALATFLFSTSRDQTFREAIISYQIKDGVVFYTYKDEPVEVLKDEIVEKRTSNARYFETDSPNKVSVTYSIGNPYYQDIDNSWHYVNSATTTKQYFARQTEPSLVERILGKKALADTADEQISEGAYSGYEKESDGTNSTGGSYAYIPADSSPDASARYWGGMMWDIDGSGLYQGDSIDVAYIEVTGDDNSKNNANINLHFELGASPAEFTTDNYDITSRSRTTASVPWVQDALSRFNWWESPSLVTPLQEVVDSYTPAVLVVITRPNQDVAKNFKLLGYGYGDGRYAPKLHIEYTVGVGDISPPVRSDGSPYGTLFIGTTQTTLSLTTNELATCRYGTVAGTSYDAMTNIFSNTGTRFHSTQVTGLSNGQSYTYYVRCIDQVGNKNTDDFPISFSVAAPAAPGWPGWSNIQNIYYNPTEDDSVNKYLEQAATDLRDYLQQLGKNLTIITSYKSSNSIFLEVNPSLVDLAGRGGEAFRLYTATDGIYITGKTALAVRHGAYELLERLGFRWYFKHPLWHITPNSLVELGNLNFVSEPDFITERFFGWLPNNMDGIELTKQWSKFNRLPGEGVISTGHSYRGLVSTAIYYAEHPNWYTGSAPYSPWQLEPAGNPDLISTLVEKAEDSLSNEVTSPVGYADKVKIAGVSMSPNDGGGWPPNYSGFQNVSNAVFTLANEVAKNLTTDAYVGCLSYAWHPNVPTFSLESNIYAMVTDGYNFSDTQTSYDQATGFAAKGVKVGVFKYYDWIYNKDRGSNFSSWSSVANLKEWHDAGTTGFSAPVYDGWGGQGLLKYFLAKILWDANTSVDDTIADFVNKSFAGATTEMQQYYDDLYDSPSNPDAYALKQLFSDLNLAVAAAQGNSEVLERIYYISYYTRFLWLYHNIGLSNLTNEELKGFYTFITQTRYLYIIDYVSVKGALETELTNRGLSGTSNYTEPTQAQALQWIQDGLSYFNSLSSEETPKRYIPRLLDLTALGDSTTPDVDPLYTTHYIPILIPCQAGENVTIQVKGHGTVKWFSPNGFYLDRADVNSDDAYTNITFTSTYAGNYYVQTAPYTTSYGENQFVGYIKVPGRPASVNASDIYSTMAPSTSGAREAYFYVPEGTSFFMFGSKGGGSSGTLTDPLENEYNYTYDGTDMVINNPEPGLWHLSFNGHPNGTQFYFKNIPSLVWYDPDYLLVEAGTSTPPPVTYILGDLNRDGKVNLYDASILLSRWGSTDSVDLSLADVNAGPGDISLNKIDLFDANLLMRNWRP